LTEANDFYDFLKNENILKKIKTMQNKKLLICSSGNTVHTSMHSTNETNMLTAPQQSSRRQSTEKRRKLTKSLKLAAMVFWVCMSGVSWGQITVSTTATWTTPPVGYEAGVTVASGVTLTINGALLDMNNGASILLNTGAKLIVDGSTIQAAGLGTNTWNGIIANGSGNEQFSSFPKVPKKAGDPSDWSGMLNSSQTLVTIINSEIVNALVGVNSTSGAIVRVEGGTIRDCEVGAKINPYHSSLEPSKNACHFMGTTFEWTQDIFTASNKKGIHLIDVSGVRIGGCIFDNKDPQKYCEDDRGIGVYSDRADFSASSAGNSFCFDGDDGCVKNCYGGTKGNGNTFKNLSTGVKIEGTLSAKPKVDIRFSTFTDVLQAIYALYSSGSVLSENIINVNKGNLNLLYSTNAEDANCGYSSFYSIRAISLNFSSDFTVYDNEINYDATKFTNIEVVSSSGSGKIQKNTFSNSNPNIVTSHMVYGVQAFNNNDDVEVLCNTFSNQGTDIYFDVGATLNFPMGDIDLPAGNIFSNWKAQRYRVDNTGNTTFDYHFTNNAQQTPHSLGVASTNLNVFPKTETNNFRNCDLTCSELATVSNITQAALTLYPNPSTGLVTVEIPQELQGEQDIDIAVIDHLGREVLYVQQTKVLHTEVLDLSAANKGIYYILVRSANCQLYAKLILH